MLTNVYVDAFNLYYGCLKGTPYRWLDLDALCRQLLPRDQIHRIRYFTALVSGRPGDLRQPQRQQAYLRALQTTFWRQVRGRQLEQSQFPATLTDAKGAIRKPQGW